MNGIDLIFGLALLVAVWNGWKQGFILQVCSLAGVVAGLWLAARYGAAVGALLRLDAEIAAPAGFVAVLVVVLLVVAILGRVIRKVFHFAGFGVADIVLGIAVSALKYLLVIGGLFSAMDKLNTDYTLVSAQTIQQSRSYKPVKRMSESLFPFLERVGKTVTAKTE